MPKKVGNSPRKVTADVADALWCYEKLDDPRASHASAPTAGAWNLLLWAREDRNRFYTSTLPRALTARAHAESQSNEPFFSKPRTNGEMMAIFRAYELWEDLHRIEGVPRQLIANGETLVRQWERETGARLSGECAAALASHVAYDVQTAAIATAKDPETFALYLIDLDDDECPGGPHRP